VASLPEAHPVVLFDGVCTLCDGFVTWLLRRDRRGVFRIAPLQSEAGSRYAPAEPADPERWSVIFVDGGRLYYRSDAIWRILHRLGGPYRLAAGCRFVPRFVRDAVYDVVARHRYRWFGKRPACRVPTPDEVSRFLP